MPIHKLSQLAVPRTQIFITAQDIMHLEKVSMRAAYRIIEAINSDCGRPIRSGVTVSKYCQYKGLKKHETEDTFGKLGFRVSKTK